RAMAEAQGLAFNESASALARAFWPGPLTLVLPGGGGRLPDSLRGPEGGIAVRWTSHPHTARLVAALREPLTSTSANLPGVPPAPGADAIARDFAVAITDGRLLVLDGGVLGNRPPSTVVDCTSPSPRLVRATARGCSPESWWRRPTSSSPWPATTARGWTSWVGKGGCSCSGSTGDARVTRPR